MSYFYKKYFSNIIANERDIQPNIGYRPDIDGLRAVAIIFVLLFHFYPKDFTFGFMGVDIFFVISGFLVTGIIHKNLENNSFSFSDFYLRRVKRIFPPLVLMLFVVSVLSFLLLTADELKSYGKHLMASVGFVANYVYYSESGYFDDSSELKPLLHLWSLAIEEQFYLVWPIVLCVTFKYFKKHLFWSLLTICVGSFFLNILTVEENKSLTFYSLHTRLWELALGGVLATLPIQIETLSRGQSGLRVKQIVSHVLALLGALLLFLTVYLYKNDFLFPSWFALFPTVGTALIIFSGENTVVGYVLKQKPFVYVGLISYSLYLWHWPMLSLARIVTRDANADGFKVFLFIIILLLSVCSYVFVEKKIKLQKVFWLNNLKYMLAMSILGIVGIVFFHYEGIPQRYTGITVSKEAYKALVNTPHGKWCNENIIKTEMCSIDNNTTQPTVALVGDSHANHLFPGFVTYFRAKGDNLLLLAKSGVIPFFDITSKVSPDNDLNEIFKMINQADSIHTVILSAFWANYFEQLGTDLGFTYYKNPIEDKRNLQQKNQNIIFEDGLRRTFDYLQSSGKKIIFLYDIPIFPFHVSTCQPRYIFKSSPDCMYDFAIDYKKQIGYRNTVKKVIAAYQGVKMYDPVPIICPENICTIMRDKNILYSDNFHLSVYGSKYVVGEMFK